MKMMKHIQTGLLITLLALSANGVANAKLASGGINLSSGLHQGLGIAKVLNALGIDEVSTMLTSESPLATKSVKVSRSRHPESAQHIDDAVGAGQPNVLTINRGGAKANRRDSLKGVDTKPGLDRDEFPPAMFQEGGKGASVRHINPSDNRGAGSCIGAQCRDLSDRTRVRIDVVD